MLRLLKVTGHSLTPKYQEGDFVLISKIPFLFHAPQPGDIVAFHHPLYGTMIKQVTQTDPQAQSLVVTGTHPDSIDSRHFGPISRRSLLGKVIWHIHP